MAKQSTRRKSVREVFSEDEISLIDLIRLFADRKRILFVTVAIFFIMGVLIAITSPIEYKAGAQVLSESGEGGQTASLGGLAGLAGLAGIDLPQAGSGGAGLSPAMYPTIATSEPFLLDLMQERFYFQEKGKEMSIYEYFLEERPGHIFSKLFGFFKRIPGRFFSLFETRKEWTIPVEVGEPGSERADSEAWKPKILNVTNEQKYVIAQLKPRITIEAEGRLIGVGVKMPEPYVSAQLTNIVLDKVIQYVTAYKTDKQRENLRFIEERTKEAEENFKSAQLKLATFRDQNQGIVSQTARTKEEQLVAEFNLTFNLYNSLRQQLEQTKIQLKKDTPLFTEFEPVTIPLDKAEPSTPRILLMYLALGFFIGGVATFIAIVRAYFNEPKMQETETSLSAAGKLAESGK